MEIYVVHILLYGKQNYRHLLLFFRPSILTRFCVVFYLLLILFTQTLFHSDKLRVSIILYCLQSVTFIDSLNSAKYVIDIFDPLMHIEFVLLFHILLLEQSHKFLKYRAIFRIVRINASAYLLPCVGYRLLVLFLNLKFTLPAFHK